MDFILNIDAAIFIGFLVINLIVGLFYSRGIKNIKEYAIGNRNFSTATITATIVATWIFGSSFSLNLSETYSKGLYFVIPAIADAFSFFIVAYFYAPRMSEFLGHLSVAECMGTLYGKNLRVIASISAIIPAIGNISIQFSVLAIMLNYFFAGTNTIAALIIISLLIIFYSTIGGIKSVTFTDVIQFFTFGVVIPMVAFIIWQSMENNDLIYETLVTNPNFNIKEIFDLNNPRLPNVVLLFLFFLIPGIDPAIFQRISMAKNTIQVAQSFYISGIIIACLYLTLDATGFLLLAMKAPNLNMDNVISHVLEHFIPIGFKGIFVAGIMSMIISTADSYINTAAVLFTHDFCKPFGLKLSSKQELTLVRMSSFFIGVMALLLSLYSKGLLEIILSTYSFYMPIVSVPLLLAIFGFRSSSKAVLIGMTAGFCAVVYTKTFTTLEPIIMGMLANLLFFVMCHYLLKEKGGFVGIKDASPLITIRKNRKRNLKQLVLSIKTFSITKFCENNLPKDERMLTYVGFFSTTSIFANMYSLPREVVNNYNVVSQLYAGSLVLATTLITYPLWKKIFFSKQLITILWSISIFFNLALVNTVFVILSEFNLAQATILMSNLIVIAILMRWQTAIVVIIGGVILGVKFCGRYWDTQLFSYDMMTLQFKVIYTLLFITTILIAFLKPKQEYQQLTEEKNEHLNSRISDQEKELMEAMGIRSRFIRNIQHEYHTPMTGVMSTSESLWEAYDKLPEERRKKVVHDIYTSSLRLKAFDDNIVALSKLSRAGYELQPEPINLSDLLYDRIRTCCKLYEEDKEARQFILNIEEGIIISGDNKYLTQALDNIIINCINYCPQGRVTIELKRGESEVIFVFADEGIGIPPKELEAIFDEFVVSSKTFTPAGGRGIGLAVAKRIIEAHGGKVEAKSDGVKGSTFKVSLPAINLGNQL